MRKSTFTRFILMSLIFLPPLLHYGQSEKVSLDGNLKFSSRYYSVNNRLGMKRPPVQFLLGFSPRLKIKGWEIGTSFFLQENIGDFSSSTKDFFTGYGNNISVSVKYKSLSLQAGRTTPQTIGLASGNVPIFGGRLTFSPKKSTISLFYGSGQQARRGNIEAGQKPRYERKFLGGKIQQGKDNATHFAISTIYARDQENSTILAEGIMPKSSLVGSFIGKIQTKSGFFMEGDVAASLFTNNLLTELPGIGGNKLTNGSSRLGYAGTAGIGQKGENYKLKLVTTYFSPTYNSLAVFYQQNDYLDVKLDGSLNLLQKKLNITFSTGARVRQLTQNRYTGNENLQLINRLNIQYAPMDRFSISANYSNFDMRVVDNSDRYYYNPEELVTDTIEGYFLKWSSNSFSISPQISLGKENKHRIFTSYALHTYQNADLNNQSIANESTTQNINTGYSYNIRNTTLSLTASYFNMRASSSIDSYSIAPSIRLNVFNKKLSLNSSLRFAYNERAQAIDRQFFSQIGIQYKASKKLQFKLGLFAKNPLGARLNDLNSSSFRGNSSISYTF